MSDVKKPSVAWPLNNDPCGRYFPRTAGPSILESPDVLEAVIEEIPPVGVFVEIGTWGGATAALIADRRPGALVVSVDSFVDNRFRMLWILNRRPNMRLFDGPSRSFWIVAGNARASAIYIDGDHTEEGALYDLREAARVVAPGGPILVHDYRQPGIPGVALAVDRFCAETQWRIVKQVTSLVVLHA